MTYPTLEHVAQEARPYPTHLLEGCETGLCLFSAAFLGHNDAIHFAMAGVRTTCVDVAGERLQDMREVYPPDWKFHEDDAFGFAELGRELGWQYDAVSVDTFTGDVMRRSLDSLELWCSIALKFVTLTVTGDEIGKYEIPEGWKHSYYVRSGDVHWLVLRR